jgi:GNAT superfamily N-acetyltransferase
MSERGDDVEAAERNYLAAWRLLVDHSPGCVIEETDEVLFTFVPGGVAYFNSAFVKPPADPATCLAPIEAFFAAHGAPFTVRFRSTPDSDDLSHAPGFTLAGRSPLMNAAVDEMAAPTGFDVRRVEAENWDDHVHALAAGFGMPVALTARLFGPSLAAVPEYAAFNAYVDGEVASTAALIVSDAVAGIYNVATPKAFRRRGLGEATTRAAVAEGGRRGCLMTTLQASDMGYPVYERMGFRTVATWTSLTKS